MTGYAPDSDYRGKRHHAGACGLEVFLRWFSGDENQRTVLW